MKTTTKKFLQTTIAAALAFAAVPSAMAIATIRITDGLTFVDIADGSGSDMATSTGSVSATINTFAGWSVVVTSGATFPDQGTLSLPDNHLQARVTSTGSPATTLSVLFSEFGFGPTSNFFNVADSATLSNTGANSVSFAATYNTNNLLFGGAVGAAALAASMGVGATAIGPVTTWTNPPAAQSGNFGGSVAAVAYSITQRIQFTHTGSTADRTSSAAMDVTAQAPDGGLTLSLLGMGFAGIFGLRRKFMAA